MSTLAERVAAARAVIGGAPVEEVAGAHGVEPELVARWRDLYDEGGELRLSGRMDQASFEARDRFLPLLAHEFRTPLTVIKGWVELLQAGLLDDDAARQALATVAGQVVALERITSDALDAGAVARHRLRLTVEPVDLRDVVGAVVASVPGPVRVPDGPALRVLGDRDRLERVAVGVIGHARRLGGGAPVTVTIGATAGAQALVEATIEGRTIPYEDVAVLFEPYGREDTSIGTGLGLFLCRALVTAHGGEIGVRSGAESTTFWFRLPIGGPEPGQERSCA